MSTNSYKISRGFGAFVLMCAAALTAAWLKPGEVKRSAPDFVLHDLVPTQFPGWKVLPEGAVQVINPQTQEMLDKIYSQLLNRTYVNSQGYRIMLSIAYGDDQRGGLKAHMPDVCYPAQGFALAGRSDGMVTTAAGDLPVRRLRTELRARKEPITYWFSFGQRPLKTDKAWERRMIELRALVSGTVPDGMLVRVSSIDDDANNAYRQQDDFIRALVVAVDATKRSRLTGVLEQ
jgi:EpsI family protein